MIPNIWENKSHVPKHKPVSEITSQWLMCSARRIGDSVASLPQQRMMQLQSSCSMRRQQLDQPLNHIQKKHSFVGRTSCCFILFRGFDSFGTFWQALALALDTVFTVSMPPMAHEMFVCSPSPKQSVGRGIKYIFSCNKNQAEIDQAKACPATIPPLPISFA